MSKSHYGVRYWLDRFPASRRPSYPQHHGPLQTDVAVVGGGAIGCVVAYVFAAAGIDVALFESSRVAQGEAAGASGIIFHELETDLHNLVKQHGLRDGRHLYQTARRGSLEYLSALRRLRIDCGLQTGDAIHVASGPDGVERLRKEYAARRDAGLDVASVGGAALARLMGMNGFALRTHDNATVDPYRATVGFARAAAARGARIFERSPVTRVRPGRRTVEIRTEGGTVAASTVVLATGYPIDDFKPLRRRFSRYDVYAALTPELGAGIRREMTPQSLVIRDTASPEHRLRWVGNRVLFLGGDQPAVPQRAQARALVQRTGQLMYELSVLRSAISGTMPEYAWEVQYSRTADGVPYFGPHRNYPGHLFAFGGGPGGLGLAFTAARILLRHYLGKPDKGDEPFSFTRIRE
ncbi:MAG: FAD-binding oxidoreductase [Acidobacteria bacterium]|nr:FAD-binding oxidoreductase [Acidobacteriota bacterium]